MAGKEFAIGRALFFSWYVPEITRNEHIGKTAAKSGFAEPAPVSHVGLEFRGEMAGSVHEQCGIGGGR
ncbi:MAG: hypothetical protein ABSG78_13150 [Verrucomicrobiota bacterium]|jgi:hypothetical protein